MVSKIKIYNELSQLGLHSNYLISYYRESYEEYSRINSFLTENKESTLEKYYIPLTISDGSFKSKILYPSQFIKHYPKVLIEAGAGAGKSTLLKYLFIRSLEEGYLVPVFIEFRKIDGSYKNIQDYLDELFGVEDSLKLLVKTFGQKRIVLLCDGFEEIRVKNRSKIASSLFGLMNDFRIINVVITTRPFSGIKSFNQFFNFEIKPFSSLDILSFVKLFMKDSKNLKFFQNLLSNKSVDYAPLLRNPLLLSMFVLVYQNHPEIPKMKSVFYENIFDTLYFRHDAFSKYGFVREKFSGLTKEEFRYILGMIGFTMFASNKRSISANELFDILEKVNSHNRVSNFTKRDVINDLLTQVSILVKNDDSYEFVHKSLLIYFAAYFVSLLNFKNKEKIYKKLAKVNLDLGDSERLLQFWELSSELDRIGFLSSFSIPNLEKIVNSINNQFDEKERLIDMVKSVDYVLLNGFDLNSVIPASTLNNLLLYFYGLIGQELHISDIGRKSKKSIKLSQFVNNKYDDLTDKQRTSLRRWYDDLFKGIQMKHKELIEDTNNLNSDIINFLDNL